MKTKASLSCLLIVYALLAGCYTPQFMPASRIECRLFEKTSNKPITGAQLFMVYVGAGGQVVKRGPFLTNQDGVGVIDVKSEAIWQSGAEAGFAGGHLRHIEIVAEGYQKREWHESFDAGKLDRESPITFYLEK